MFKVGDKVKAIRIKDSGTPGLALNNIYEIINLNEKYVYLEEIGGFFYHNRFELVSENFELEELIKKANEGQESFNKIFSDYKNQVEGYFLNKDNTFNLFGERNSRLRIKSQTRKFKVADWDAEINKGEIKIGCQNFIVTHLRTDLDLLLNQNQSAGYNYPIHAQRNGLWYNSEFTINWEQAEKLLKELEK